MPPCILCNKEILETEPAIRVPGSWAAHRPCAELHQLRPPAGAELTGGRSA